MSRNELPVLAVIAVGGGLGALARFGLSTLWPPLPRHVPWATLVTNVLGCLLIGVLMVLVTDVWAAHRLVRPFLGIGVLGGFTTFSTYAVEGHGLFADGAPVIALGYIAGSVVLGLAAVVIGVGATRVASGTVVSGRRRR
ncbi:MAG TPA: CrcB family protein [Aldersonia sp.]